MNEEFEKWLEDSGYANYETVDAIKAAWQARDVEIVKLRDEIISLKEALASSTTKEKERCAEICINEADSVRNDGSSHDQIWETACNVCAEVILRKER